MAPFRDRHPDEPRPRSPTGTRPAPTRSLRTNVPEPACPGTQVLLAEPLRSNPLASPPPEQRAKLPGGMTGLRHLLGLDWRAARPSLVAAGAVADKAGRAGP